MAMSTLQFLLYIQNSKLFDVRCVEFCCNMQENNKGCLLLGGAHLLKEGNEGHEAVIIFRFTKFLHQTLGLLLGKLLSKVGKETEKFISNHGIVVKLKDFNEVMEATLVLGVLACLVHGEDISLGEHLLSLLRLSSDLLNSLEGGVQVAGTDEITSIEGINLAISLEVIDIKGKVDGIDFLLLKTKLSHCVLLLLTLDNC